MKFMKCLVCKRSENTHVKHTNLKESEIVLQECLRRDLQWNQDLELELDPQSDLKWDRDNQLNQDKVQARLFRNQVFT